MAKRLYRFSGDELLFDPYLLGGKDFAGLSGLVWFVMGFPFVNRRTNRRHA